MKEKVLKAYVIRVNKETGQTYRGRFEEVPNELEALQRLVNFDEAGGLIQVISIGDIDIICHDEGKLLGFPPTRFWYENGKVIDAFVGNLICCRADLRTGEFTDILDEDVEVLNKVLKPAFKSDFGSYLLIPSERWLPDYEES